MENLSRKEQQASLRKRLEPLLATTLSNNEVARRAHTSATTIARYRKQRGITLDVVKGGDGKDYAIGGDKAKTILQICRHLHAVRALMLPEMMTPEVVEMLGQIHQSVQRVKA